MSLPSSALLDAFARASRAGLPPDVKLVCTGAPNPRQEMLARAAQSAGLEGRVLFPGFLPEEESSALMENCGGVVFPSLYEGFGLPALEALARGAPLAVADGSALEEVVGDAALLFGGGDVEACTDALDRLLSDDALRGELSRRGPKRAGELTWAHSAAAHVTAYERAIAIRAQRGDS